MHIPNFKDVLLAQRQNRPELSFFRENLILKGSPPRNIPGQIGS